jgi:hypothetical protein
VPFKANAKCRHHIPKQKRRRANWPAYEVGLRPRGDLTVWFSEAAIAAWRAASWTNRGWSTLATVEIAIRDRACDR